MVIIYQLCKVIVPQYKKLTKCLIKYDNVQKFNPLPKKNRTPIRKSWCGESISILQLLKYTYKSSLSSLQWLADRLDCSVLQQIGKVTT